MARQLQVQIMERARALVADERHWCRGQLAENARGQVVLPISANAVRRRGLGAVIDAAFQLTQIMMQHTYSRKTRCGHTAASALLCMSMMREAMRL
jgi:hypothetical protein